MGETTVGTALGKVIQHMEDQENGRWTDTVSVTDADKFIKEVDVEKIELKGMTTDDVTRWVAENIDDLTLIINTFKMFKGVDILPNQNDTEIPYTGLISEEIDFQYFIRLSTYDMSERSIIVTLNESQKNHVTEFLREVRWVLANKNTERLHTAGFIIKQKLSALKSAIDDISYIMPKTVTDSEDEITDIYRYVDYTLGCATFVKRESTEGPVISTKALLPLNCRRLVEKGEIIVMDFNKYVRLLNDMLNMFMLVKPHLWRSTGFIKRFKVKMTMKAFITAYNLHMDCYKVHKD